MKSRKHKPKPWDQKVLPKDCPYTGPMAQGWLDYHAGKPPQTKGDSHRGVHSSYWQGYSKAKLAAEQGKKSL